MDIDAAEDIFGPNLHGLKGKTTQQKVKHARVTLLAIPLQIKNRYRCIQLCISIVKVNSLRFFISKSRHVKFTTIEFITNELDETLLKCIISIKTFYLARGFTIETILADGQFQSLELAILNESITLNICSRAEHVYEIERMNRTVKERVQGIYNNLPFTHMPI